MTNSNAAATIVLAVLLGLGVQGQRDGLRVIGGQAAPVVVAAADLYFALNDMDAQVANVLLVGQAPNLGFTRDQAQAIYEQRRVQADADLQAIAAAGGDETVRRQVRQVLDLLGSYEALAAQTILLEQQAALWRRSWRCWVYRRSAGCRWRGCAGSPWFVVRCRSDPPGPAAARGR